MGVTCIIMRAHGDSMPELGAQHMVSCFLLKAQTLNPAPVTMVIQHLNEVRAQSAGTERRTGVHHSGKG